MMSKLKSQKSKVAHLWQLGFFSLCSPDCPKQHRISNLFPRFLYPMIYGTISALGVEVTDKNDQAKVHQLIVKDNQQSKTIRPKN